ncbi:MAG: DegT/DnrJ/EryC1/StrS aminotransferase [Akkermansiaceae bacterium]|nr:DegT/DnrJ/EryC1/StrS aminotransferase [Akkermansiaceae bacterium]
MSAPLPFLPMTQPTIDEETIAGVCEVLRSGWITSGPKVKEFEAALSALFGGRPVRVFNSGTATLEIALRIAGIGPGDEVITTPLTWVASSNVILEVGARPVFVDVDPVTRNIDLEKISAAITPATKAILPVDLAGLPVDRDRLYEIAAQHGLRVIEDAAQSLGSTWNGKPIGAQGDLISFSFHPNKNLTSIEGGCLVLRNDAEAFLAEQYRLQGVVRSGVDGMDVAVLGGKFNLTDVAARVGLGQIPHLEEFTARRRQLVKAYFEAFSGHPIAGLELPLADFTNCNWHMFQVVLPESAETRAAVMEKMKDAGIGTGVHYPAIHLFTLYRALGWKEGDLPNAESLCRRILTLPLFPSMSDADPLRVVKALASILEPALSR